MGAAVPIATLILAAGSTGYSIHSSERQRKESKRDQDESLARQNQAAVKQEEALRAQPKRVDPTAPEDRTKRLAALRSGIASTIKTSPMGVSGQASTYAPALKAKLGQ